jgi:hypothetical protein
VHGASIGEAAAARAAHAEAVRARVRGLQELVAERQQRRWWLLSPMAVGVLGELAFDVSVASPVLHELCARLPLFLVFVFAFVLSQPVAVSKVGHLTEFPALATDAGGDNGIVHDKNRLRFLYVFIFLRSHYLPHP